jgi:tetratricopeptide (TPR) repeat protein
MPDIYKTSDGQLHDERYKAESHQRDLDRASSSSSSKPYYGTDQGTVLFREGKEYINAKDWDKAIDKFTQSINSGGVNKGNAYLSRGICYSQKKNWDQAINDYTNAINVGIESSNNALIFYNRGVAYYYNGNKEQAISDYKKAADLGDSNAMENLASMGIQYNSPNNSSVKEYEDSILYYQKQLDAGYHGYRSSLDANIKKWEAATGRKWTEEDTKRIKGGKNSSKGGGFLGLFGKKK